MTNDLSNSVKQNENNQIREANLGLREKILNAMAEHHSGNASEANKIADAIMEVLPKPVTVNASLKVQQSEWFCLPAFVPPKGQEFLAFCDADQTMYTAWWDDEAKEFVTCGEGLGIDFTYWMPIQPPEASDE